MVIRDDCAELTEGSRAGMRRESLNDDDLRVRGRQEVVLGPLLARVSVTRLGRDT